MTTISYKKDSDIINYGKLVARLHEICQSFNSSYNRFKLNYINLIESPLHLLFDKLEGYPEHQLFIKGLD